MSKPNVVIAGREIWAGLDEFDAAEVSMAMVVTFPDRESLQSAIQSGRCEFDVFRDDSTMGEAE